MNLVIFIHTCKQYEETRSKLLENTWANSDNIVFITDNEHSTLNNHIYMGPYKRDGFSYHPESLKKMFNLFLERYSHYDFFMIVDDDSYVYVEKLKLYLSFFDKDQPYMIGDFLNWPYVLPDYKFGGNYNNWVGGGPGIVFTKSCIIEYIRLYNEHNIPLLSHDVWLHYLYSLSNSMIKRTHCPGFHQYDSDKLYKTFPKDSNNLVSVHFNGDMSLLEKYH